MLDVCHRANAVCHRANAARHEETPLGGSLMFCSDNLQCEEKCQENKVCSESLTSGIQTLLDANVFPEKTIPEMIQTENVIFRII